MDWEEVFEWNPVNLMISVVFYLGVMVLIWEFPMEGMEWDMQNKMIISIFALPLFYFVITWRLNK